jgi:exosortase A-associated hydrolase 1/exosortase A-associated hydrolase 2
MLSTIKTGFLEGPNGKLHVSIFVPAQAVPLRGCVIHVPAFAEEMNKCRPMVSRQARRLAESGVVVVVPDLFGTGDSEGEFGAASWNVWKRDLMYIIEWLCARGAENVMLWGVRLGCLLAVDVAEDASDSVTALLFWQPVHNGQQHITQFLRLRMAASMMKGNSENVAQLREKLLQGESIEVAGYLLSPRLFREIQEVTMAGFKMPSGLGIEILEVVGEAGKGLLPVTRKQFEQWQSLGFACTAATVPGDPFWMTQEIAFAPSLVDATAGSVGRLSATEEKVEGAINMQLGGLLSLNVNANAEQAGEESMVFPCETQDLVGLLHRPEVASKIGIVIVVGGPQYRVGSHRQFVQLARYLCDKGIPVFRFDYRGMGDSSGDHLGFEGVDTDIRCAIDNFQRKCPSVTDIVIWGLCDAATAAVFYAPGDARVKGLVLVNPWVYSVQGAAKAYLKHYYWGRLFSKAFWEKVLRGEFNPVASATSAVHMVENALDKGSELTTTDSQDALTSSADAVPGGLVVRFTKHLGQFSGKALVILSGNDLTAAEFMDAVGSNRKLRKLMKGSDVRREILRDADHTFSKREWSTEVELITATIIGDL